MRLAFYVICVLIERQQYLICSNMRFVIGRQEGTALRSSSLIGVLHIVLWSPWGCSCSGQEFVADQEIRVHVLRLEVARCPEKERAGLPSIKLQFPAPHILNYSSVSCSNEPGTCTTRSQTM